MVVNLISKKEKTKEEILLNKIHTSNINALAKNDIIVGGQDEIKVTLANCCKPVKGDDVIGYITKGNGIVVHRSICHNVCDVNERIIPIEWNMNSTNKYETSIIIRTEKSDNILVNIISMASTSNVNVQTLNIINNTDFQTYNLVVLVDNIDRLNSFLNALYQMKEIIEVQRIIN